MPELKDIILGNVAVERGIVTRETLLDLQRQQRDTNLPLGQVMLRAGAVTGSRLIELMKLVNLTIQHLDGGLEVGIESTEESHSPAVPVGPARETTAPVSALPVDKDGIPFAPVVGGAGASVVTPERAPATRAPASRAPFSRPAAAAASTSPVGDQTPRPMRAPGGSEDRSGTPTPAPHPSPFEAPRTAPAAKQPASQRFDAARVPASPGAAAGGNKVKTEAFNFDQMTGTYKPKTEIGSGAPARPKTEMGLSRPKTEAIPGPKPKTGTFAKQAESTSPASRKFGTANPNPGTRRFGNADAGRPKTETFEAQLVNDTPETSQPGFGDSGGKKDKKDATLLFNAPDSLHETPAGKLAPDGEPPPVEKKEGSISLPPQVRKTRPPTLGPGGSTPAGRMPSGVDAESKHIESPLDDLPPIENPPEFTLPADESLPTASAQRPPSKPPAAGKRPASHPPAAPGSAPPVAASGPRLQKPDDSGFLAESDLPDFEVRAGDKPGQKAVMVNKPKPQSEPPKGAGKGGKPPPPNKGPKPEALTKSAAAAAASKKGGAPAADAKDKEKAEEEPPKKKRGWIWLTIVILLLLALSPIVYLMGAERLDPPDLKNPQKVWAETQKLFQEIVDKVQGVKPEPAPLPKQPAPKTPK